MNDTPYPSTEDLALLADKQRLEAKVAARQRVLALLKDLQAELKGATLPYRAHLPAQLDTERGAMHQGEFYQDTYPYQLLDYPKYIRQAARGGGRAPIRTSPEGRLQLLLWRSICLWGHGWSCHLMLAGVVAEPLRQRLAERIHALKKLPVLLDGCEDPWDWSPEPGSLPSLASLDEGELKRALLEAPVLKLSAYWPMAQQAAFMHDSLQLWQALLPLLAQPAR